MQVPNFSAVEVTGRRVLVRQDLNVPIQNGQITSDARIRAALPTLKEALDRGAQVLVMSHLGRPKEGLAISAQPEVSLAPVAKALSVALGRTVDLVSDYLGGLPDIAGDIVLLENVRINSGEKSNDPELAKRLADLCDVFVMDAFGTAHRAHASTVGVAAFAKSVCAGPLLAAELEALSQALEAPEAPVVAIVGGSKVSTKLEVLEALSSKVDSLIVGGGIANTFIAAEGAPVGQSLYEPDLMASAKRIAAKVKMPAIIDVVVADRFSADAEAVIKPVAAVNVDEQILDLGPETMAGITALIGAARTIIWNGPVGVFEFPSFAGGTRALTEAIAASSGFSLAGGGDTLSAIDTFGAVGDISYISTGGGAFLEFIEGKTLPAIAALQTRALRDGAT